MKTCVIWEDCVSNMVSPTVINSKTKLRGQLWLPMPDDHRHSAPESWGLSAAGCMQQSVSGSAVFTSRPRDQETTSNLCIRPLPTYDPKRPFVTTSCSEMCITHSCLVRGRSSLFVGGGGLSSKSKRWAACTSEGWWECQPMESQAERDESGASGWAAACSSLLRCVLMPRYFPSVPEAEDGSQRQLRTAWGAGGGCNPCYTSTRPEPCRLCNSCQGRGGVDLDVSLCL